MILNTCNKPFFFDFNINDSAVKDLIDKSPDYPINITYDHQIFNLFITDDLGKNHLIVKGLSKSVNFKKIFESVAKQLSLTAKTNHGLNEKEILNQLWFRKKVSREVIEMKNSLETLKI